MGLDVSCLFDRPLETLTLTTFASFIIEGLATMFVGGFCWWMVFDWPDTARFLTPDERLRVRRRLAEDKQSSTGEEYDKRHIIAALKDWKCWGYAVM